MARLIHTPTGGGLVGSFEPKVLDALLQELPDTFLIAPNFQLKQKGHDALEYDFVVVAPHAVYVIEAKEWYGRITGDDSEWLLNQKPKKCPLWLVNTKCKVLKTDLGPVGTQVHVAPLLVLPNGTQNLLGGSWAHHVRSLSGTVAFVQDPARLSKSGDIRGYHDAIVKALQGKWGARQRGQRRSVGSYEILETVFRDERTAEYLARRTLIEGDPTRYRIRTWRLNQEQPAEDVARQKALIQRPTEAVARIGPHPNLLRILQFDFIEEDNEFFEVTEWSEFGTLHGYLENQERDRLTLRERLEIAEGVAAALEAVHAHQVVHRNVCPETILLGFDRKPRLIDFDRAYLEGRQTVFAATVGQQRNPAYVPPELDDATDYDFDTSSDMYSFGVLLHRLLVDRVPFADAKEARAAQGRASASFPPVRDDVDARLRELLLGLLRVDDFKARPSATEALGVLRDALGLTTGVKAPTAPSQPLLVQSFDKGNVLDGVWRIDEKLGAGAFSKVFKVFNLDHQRTYAMKVLAQQENADLALDEFRTIKGVLPDHPNLARIEWMARLAPPNDVPYVLYEYIDGETLEPYCDGRKRLAWSDIQRIGTELLDGLEAMHERKVLHRDIKPANILLQLPTHRPKLIDFNISASMASAKGAAGTPRYWAPDRGRPEWRPDADLFSLGVVLYELVTHRHPFPHDRPEAGAPADPRSIAPELHLSEALASFLVRAVQPKAGDRFGTAAQMREAFARIPAMYAPAGPPSVAPGRFPGLHVSPEEAVVPNRNPYVRRLLTLYSQARRTNAGTRGLDEIGRLTYVTTKLDTELAPAIVSGSFRLVVVTGNAGDGKTAFLQRVEQLFADAGAPSERLASGNGSRWSHHGVEYETNYDGSQDEGSRSNDEVLAHFFAPFAGAALGGLQGPQTRLIAINEGRLLDFLAHGAQASRFEGLRRFVLAALEGGASPARALLVNLNLRAVAAGGDQSLVERQLQTMLRPELWAPCEGCAHRGRCPIKHNVDTLRDTASGAATRARVRRLFEVVHLRRRSHVTMRDLRSALSWMLLRDHDCEDVERLLGREDARLPEALAWIYYPNAFAEPDVAASPSGASSGGAMGGEERAVDRLVRQLREVDVGRVEAPLLDHRLDRDPGSAVPWMTYEQRSEHGREVMDALGRHAPAVGDDVSLPSLLAVRRNLLAMRRRWAYFERRDEGWNSMLPYRSTALLEQLLASSEDEQQALLRGELRNRVVDAISLAEGVRSPNLRRRFLALKVTRVKDTPLRSYRLFPRESFRVEVTRLPSLGRYLEYAPDAVELVAGEGRDGARLRISLDLLEMLELIREGYRPTSADLQGLFVNLLIFRNELLTTTFDRVLVTEDDATFYEIAAQGRPDGIRLSLARHTEEGT
ncbi:protein kinase [Corallococcus exiguus]|uniref:methylation-associated defense system protein kinase MAD6 n=1 Tax=Corallococcus exiguus TaxID=83462 RepID=UPI001471FD0E|nr:serine/threonine protein kinase [Corallococcus exiguus]NNC16693.1 protein kinase [Corallococcus exiguus]